MNNNELFTKIKEILEQGNPFDTIIKLKEFDKDYKGSDFYKITKMSLREAIEYYRVLKPFNILSLKQDIQELLDGLNLDNVNDVMDKMAATFAQENAEIQQNIGLVKEYAKRP